MLPNAQAEQSENLQLPAEIVELAKQNIAEIYEAADGVLPAHPDVQAGYTEKMAAETHPAEVEPIKVDFSPRNLTTDELRNFINRNAA
jgi:hypothetical protein